MVQSSIENSNGLHDLLMKDHISETLQGNRKHLDRYRKTGATGYFKESVDEQEQEDQMKILASGNVTVHQAPPVQPSQGTLPKALLLAAALFGGPALGAAAVGIPWLLSRLEKPATVAPVAPQPGKTTTIERDYEIGPVTVEAPGLFE